ncbi:MAG: hypothetical protein LBC73_00915 [Oscillospiraceae bacterium]|jgi:hypothetical protein|nr:hypothetical protein [Oscillospiraceae bacterium]
MKLFKPVWQSKNPGKRRKFISKTNSQDILKKIAASDPVLEVRLLAIEKIHDDEFLAFLANNMENTKINDVVIAKLSSPDVIFALITHGKTIDIVQKAALKLAKMSDKRVLDYLYTQNIFYDQNYIRFILDFMDAMEYTPCQEMVYFLEKVLKSSYNDSYSAFVANKKLRSICIKAQGTPLEEYIKGITQYNENAKFNMY